MLYDVVWCVVFCGTECHHVILWFCVVSCVHGVVLYYVWYIIQRGVVEESYLTHGLLFTELNKSIINPY